jgi:hypothetical protein
VAEDLPGTAVMRAVALGEMPVARLTVPDAALVTPLAVGQPGLSRREIRQTRTRLAALAERGGAVVPALRTMVRRVRGARMAAYRSGG